MTLTEYVSERAAFETSWRTCDGVILHCRYATIYAVDRRSWGKTDTHVCHDDIVSSLVVAR